jgi:hypothetical protein
MNTYLVRISIPTYDELEAHDEQEAEDKAIALYREVKPTWKEPTVEVIMANGFPTSFWDVVDAAIDDDKERVM